MTEVPWLENAKHARYQSVNEPNASENLKAMPGIYCGLFLISLSTLVFEILLTRLFSATMFYHFTFMVLSLAMFGLAVGANLVYIFPHWFRQERASSHMSLFSLLFGLSTAASMIFYLCVLPIFLKNITSSLFTIVVVLSYIGYAVPFICSGVCTCLALTRFKAQTGKLYAFDLLGGIGLLAGHCYAFHN